MKLSTCSIIFFLVLQTIYSQNKKIEITYEKNSDKSINFYYKKNLPGSYYLILEFDRLENCHNNTTFKKVLTNSSGSLFTLKPYNSKKGFLFFIKRDIQLEILTQK